MVSVLAHRFRVGHEEGSRRVLGSRETGRCVLYLLLCSLPSGGASDFLMRGKERDSKEKVVRKVARPVGEQHVIVCHQRLLFAQEA